jgi:hypothetical protein
VSDSAPSEARKRGSGGGSPRKARNCIYIDKTYRWNQCASNNNTYPQTPVASLGVLSLVQLHYSPVLISSLGCKPRGFQGAGLRGKKFVEATDLFLYKQRRVLTSFLHQAQSSANVCQSRSNADLKRLDIIIRIKHKNIVDHKSLKITFVGTSRHGPSL